MLGETLEASTHTQRGGRAHQTARADDTQYACGWRGSELALRSVCDGSGRVSRVYANEPNERGGLGRETGAVGHARQGFTETNHN